MLEVMAKASELMGKIKKLNIKNIEVEEDEQGLAVYGAIYVKDKASMEIVKSILAELQAFAQAQAEKEGKKGEPKPASS